MEVLAIRALHVCFGRRGTDAAVVRDVSLSVARHEAVALVGESGCGKTMTALSTLRLLPRGARISCGSVTVDGLDVTALDERELVRVRGRKVGMVFQEPSSYLNPVFSVGTQVEEAVCLPEVAARRQRTEDLFQAVRVALPGVGLKLQKTDVRGRLNLREVRQGEV